jgi:hypothetical protein
MRRDEVAGEIKEIPCRTRIEAEAKAKEGKEV